MPREEFFKIFRRSIENDENVIVARFPWIMQELPRVRFKRRNNLIAQPIERVAKRGAPVLVPARASAVAAAILHPAAHAVRTTPGGSLVNLDLVRGWTTFEILAVIGDP